MSDFLTRRLPRALVLCLVLLCLGLATDLGRRALSDERMRNEEPLRTLLIRVARQGLQSDNGLLRARPVMRMPDFAQQPLHLMIGDFGSRGTPEVLVVNGQGEIWHATQRFGRATRLHQMDVPVAGEWMDRARLWMPARFPTATRDEMLLLDPMDGVLRLFEVPTMRKRWALPLTGTRGTVQGTILPLVEGNRAVGIAVFAIDARRLFFVSPEGEFLDDVWARGDARIVALEMAGRARLLLVDPDGAWRLFEASGALVREDRFDFPREATALSLVPVQLADGRLGLRADFPRAVPILFDLEGGAPRYMENENARGNSWGALWTQRDTLDDGRILMSAGMSVTLFAADGRVLDTTQADDYYISLIDGPPTHDGARPAIIHDSMNDTTSLGEIRIRR
ncbi:MAG: hypothetical protein KF858_16170 [Candidatus Sumerlaeia bacterium]|nr:hypothetical protein [Candidatus Sumerlaeia bacterium]